MRELTITNPDVAIKLTAEQAKQFNILENVKGDVGTRSPWGVVDRYKALCISAKYDGFPRRETEVKIHGQRTMSQPRQNGYYLDGYVSIKGKKHSAFTSSKLFDIDGDIIDVAVIYAMDKNS